MKNFFTLIVLIGLLQFAKSQSAYLRIGDVRNSWSTQKGSVDTLQIDISPKGLYTSVSLTYNVSTRGTTYNSETDSLEIQYYFKLPKSAEVTDMWLWVENVPVQAGMYDIWTASQIYEDIVGRRKDPAILYKYMEYEYYGYTYEYNYMLRVFPMNKKLPRQFRITYLVPANDLNSGYSNLNIPVSLLGLDKFSILKGKIAFYPDANYKEPEISGNPAISFTEKNGHLETIIDGNMLKNNFSINFKNNLNKDAYVCTYQDNKGENYYELNIHPKEIFSLNTNKKVIFLFDFIKENTSTITIDKLLFQLKDKLHNSLSEKDSFNIIISGMINKELSNTWLPADSLTIESTFNLIKKSDFNSFSALPSLLMDGINFVKNNHGGSIVLIASSNSNGTYVQANELNREYLNLIGNNKIPVNVLNLDDSNIWYEEHYIGGAYFYGNEYLYFNLTRQSSGEYYSLREISYEEMLNDILEKLSGHFNSYDLYITLENGYTYSKYNVADNSTFLYFDQPVKEIGKYYGTGKFKGVLSAQTTDGVFYHNEFTINENNVVNMDSVIRTSWYMQLLREMKSFEQTNTVIAQIVDISKKSRVLTEYTALLALEPGRGQIDQGEDNEGGQVGGIDDAGKNSDEYNCRIYPNPAGDYVFIEYTLNQCENVELQIFDIYGKKVKEINDGKKQKGEFTLKLDIKDLLPGTYICKIKLGNNIKQLKIVKI